MSIANLGPKSWVKSQANVTGFPLFTIAR